MTAYADFSFYSKAYLGRIIPNENDFAYYALRASELIDSKTFRRIKEVTEAVRLACCTVAEELYSADTAKSRAASGISSESVDGYSISYRAYDDKSADESKKRVEKAIQLYLADTGLMFRGCSE